jgi:two-component system, LytTR family, sensor kinase
LLKILPGKNSRFQPVFMHPAIFIGLSGLLGFLFASQEWITVRRLSYRVGFGFLIQAWEAYYLVWGVICWLLWWWLGERIQGANVFCILTRVLPLSILASVVQEMIFVSLFPDLPLNRPHMNYWHRLAFELNDMLLTNMVIFWCAFGLFRAIGYYQKFREKEDAAAQLEVRLANAQISALRMQLNPHFLFNTMNSISSLMRTDVSAADTMLEQLGSLLRITLKRGDAQLIPLRDEMEFLELYLAMQDRRFGSRIRQSVEIDSELHDALVPAMILQPIVENAYAHGLSKLDRGGVLSIEARRVGNRMRLSVINNGLGLQSGQNNGSSGRGLGLSNVKARLRLHYGMDQEFLLRELGRDKVQVAITLPLTLCDKPEEQITRFGAE